MGSSESFGGDSHGCAPIATEHGGIGARPTVMLDTYILVRAHTRFCNEECFPFLLCFFFPAFLGQWQR